jgi:hypothetical protein
VAKAAEAATTATITTTEATSFFELYMLRTPSRLVSDA